MGTNSALTEMKSEVTQSSSHPETVEIASSECISSQEDPKKTKHALYTSKTYDHARSKTAITSGDFITRENFEDPSARSEMLNGSISKLLESLDSDEDRLVSNLVDEFNNGEHHDSIGAYVMKKVGDDHKHEQSFSFIRANPEGSVMDWMTKFTDSFMASLASELGDTVSTADIIIAEQQKYLSDMLSRELLTTNKVNAKHEEKTHHETNLDGIKTNHELNLSV
mmetsp:Transcript_20527/g.26949  ORF Transcript_20527/g.26949 Transcript_20527/m.26949 type:complete len:224 (+) Transcript_20527:68-739(+)